MKVIELQKSFGLENLVMTERPKPTPKYGEILLKMKAASLNYRDLITIQGNYNPKQPLPLIPCSDGVGEVVEVGECVTKVHKGQRVATTFFQEGDIGNSGEKVKATLGGPLDGTLSEFMLLKENGVIPVPDHLTDEEAATLPCAALTAWNAVVEYGLIKPGNTILIQGTGGVALFSLLFAKILGAKIIITSGSESKLERAKSLGANHGINYKKVQDWAKEARNLTAGNGVDLVIELGGAGTLTQSFQAVKIGGSIALIGVLAGITKDLSIIPIIMKNIRVQGILVGNKDQFFAMNQAIAFHKIKPIVSNTFFMNETRKAFEYMASAAHFGKICIKM